MKAFPLRLFALSLVSGTLLPAAAVAADNWDVGFQPHAELGIADYTLDVSATTQTSPISPSGVISTGKLSFGEVMPSISAGLTVFANHFFVDFAAQRIQTYNQTMSDSHTINSSSLNSLQIAQESYETDDFTRDEFTLSVGYGITEAFSVYAGYKKQYTELNDLVGSGPISFLTAGESNPMYGTFNTFADIEFDYDGPFAGATTGWNFDQGAFSGRLSVSAAIAFLEGSLRANSPGATVTFNNVSTPLPVTLADILNTDGDTVGVSLGASWLGHTRIAGLSYTVSVNGYDYEFSADTNGRPEVDESVLQLKVGLAYAF